MGLKVLLLLLMMPAKAAALLLQTTKGSLHLQHHQMPSHMLLSLNVLRTVQLAMMLQVLT